MISVLFYLNFPHAFPADNFFFSSDSTLLVLLLVADYSFSVSFLGSFSYLLPKFCSFSEAYPLVSFFPSLDSLINPLTHTALLIYSVLSSSRPIATSLNSFSCSKYLHKTVHSARVPSNSTCLKLKLAYFLGFFTSHINWQGMPILYFSYSFYVPLPPHP